MAIKVEVQEPQERVFTIERLSYDSIERKDVRRYLSMSESEARELFEQLGKALDGRHPNACEKSAPSPCFWKPGYERLRRGIEKIKATSHPNSTNWCEAVKMCDSLLRGEEA